MRTENAATLRKPQDQPGFYFMYLFGGKGGGGVRETPALLASHAICALTNMKKAGNKHASRLANKLVAGLLIKAATSIRNYKD